MTSKNNIYNTNLNRIDFLIFTNGTGNIDDYIKLIKNGFSLAFSRHHFNEDKNNLIFNGTSPIISGNKCFGLHSLKEDVYLEKRNYFYNNHKIPYLNQREGKVLFSANMLNNGLSSIKDIVDYLYWISSLEVESSFKIGTTKPIKVIFSNLHNEANLGKKVNSNYEQLLIDERIMDEFDKWFVRESKQPIISSSGYILLAYHFDLEKNFSIKFYLKRYLNKNQFEKEWNNKYNRKYIDLSMDPNGDIYTDYSQSKKLILK